MINLDLYMLVLLVCALNMRDHVWNFPRTVMEIMQGCVVYGTRMFGRV